jgi:catechol 2,3-dioxygenase-like lactoylglutathione lyase family enzyme
MNWKIRSDDGKQAVMDIGDWASVLVQGGYQPPPPPPAPAPTPGDSAGRGGGRGGGAGRAPRNAVWDSFCWGIDQWDKNKVEAELRKRGLNPIYEMSAGVETFRIQDPGGFTVRIADGRKNRRSGSSSAPLPAPAPFEGTDWRSVWLDHISFQCPSYKESTAFYEALLGWKSRGDEGSQATCEIGDIGGIIIRGGAGPTGGRGGGAQQAPTRRIASMDHISFGITPWDADKVKAELDKRGLSARVDTGGGGDIHTSKFQSYHTTTPNGFDLQISNVTKATRTL